MSNTYFISDLHLGHEGALQWARDFRDGSNIKEHNQILIDKINSVVNKRDTLFILGDVSWRSNQLHLLAQIPCTMKLVRGNHDDRHINEYLAYFDEVYGLLKYKDYWLSHAPIHPHELRGSKNIHGHTHQNGVVLPQFVAKGRDNQSWDREILIDQWDRNYISVCVESYNGYPVPFEDIKDNTYWNKRIV